MPEAKFTFLGIPNDYGVMDISFFTLSSEEVTIIDDHLIPYAVRKHKKHRGPITHKYRQRLLIKLAKGDLEMVNFQEDKDEEDEESEEE